MMNLNYCEAKMRKEKNERNDHLVKQPLEHFCKTLRVNILLESSSVSLSSRHTQITVAYFYPWSTRKKMKMKSCSPPTFLQAHRSVQGQRQRSASNIINKDDLLDFTLFLDAISHLYNRAYPSVFSSVSPSVRPSVRPSVTYELNF